MFFVAKMESQSKIDGQVISFLSNCPGHLAPASVSKVAAALVLEGGSVCVMCFPFYTKRQRCL